MIPSRSATVDDVFIGEGEFNLRLGIDELIQLQELSGHGPAALLRRLMDGTWFVQELTQTVRLSLIGGGLKPADAFGVVKRNLTEAHLMDYVPVAITALSAALLGVPDDPVGEPEAAETTGPVTIAD